MTVTWWHMTFKMLNKTLQMSHDGGIVWAYRGKVWAYRSNVGADRWQSESVEQLANCEHVTSSDYCNKIGCHMSRCDCYNLWLTPFELTSMLPSFSGNMPPRVRITLNWFIYRWSHKCDNQMSTKYQVVKITYIFWHKSNNIIFKHKRT